MSEDQDLNIFSILESQEEAELICLFAVVLSKFEAFFMDSHFDLRQWKKSTFLPALSISLLMIIGLLIFLSSLFNWIYLKKKAYKKEKAKFKRTVSFKTLWSGVSSWWQHSKSYYPKY